MQTSRLSFSVIAATSTGVVFVIAGLAFRSLLIPLRLLVTIAATLVFTAGAAVLTYQVGYLGTHDGIYWLLPIACGTMVVGITIDYDIFLVSRCYELRRQGYTTEASIVRAIESQAATITTAGVIMSIAFSSLLLSETAVLNEWGFMLLAPCLYDTFIVRTLIVPALLFCAVEANWWPGKMPTPSRDADGQPLSLHVN